MSDVSTEDFGTGELKPAARLFTEVFNAAPWNDSWTSHLAETRLAEVLAAPGYRGVAARVGEDLVGFAIGNAEQWFTGKHFLIRELCVRADVRRSGVGSAIHSALEARLADVEQIYLLTDRSGPAAAFYERQGFRAARRQGVMVKRLAG